VWQWKPRPQWPVPPLPTPRDFSPRAPRGPSPAGNLTLPHRDSFQTSSFQNVKKINVYCFKAPSSWDFITMATENWNSLQELLIDRSVWHLSVPVSPGRSTLFHWSLALESPLPLTLIYPVLNSQSSVQVPGSLPMKQLQPQFRLSLSLACVPLCPTQAIASLILTCGFPDNSLPLACQFHMVQPSGYSWNIGGKFLDINILKYSKTCVSLFQHFLQESLDLQGSGWRGDNPSLFVLYPALPITGHDSF